MSDTLHNHLHQAKQRMLQPSAAESVVDSCHREVSVFEHAIQDPAADPLAISLATEAIAIAMAVAEVYPHELTSRRAWEFYLVAASIRSEAWDLLDGAATEFWSCHFHQAKGTLDHPTAILLMAMSRPVELRGKPSEFLRNIVLQNTRTFLGNS